MVILLKPGLTWPNLTYDSVEEKGAPKKREQNEIASTQIGKISNYNEATHRGYLKVFPQRGQYKKVQSESVGTVGAEAEKLEWC